MSSDLRRLFAAALAQAEREYQDAQSAVATDPTDDARARYAKAERQYQRLEQLLEEADPHGTLKQLQDYAWGKPRTFKS